jgi:hypothetical protein
MNRRGGIRRDGSDFSGRSGYGLPDVASGTRIASGAQPCRISSVAGAAIDPVAIA